ncbi:unnamed protein product [Closterium sp. NIES-53]
MMMMSNSALSLGQADMDLGVRRALLDSRSSSALGKGSLDRMPQPAAVNTLRSVGSGSIHSGAAHAIPITREAAFSRRALHVPASGRLAPPSAASTTAYGARGLTGVPNEFRSQVSRPQQRGTFGAIPQVLNAPAFWPNCLLLRCFITGPETELFQPLVASLPHRLSSFPDLSTTAEGHVRRHPSSPHVHRHSGRPASCRSPARLIVSYLPTTAAWLLLLGACCLALAAWLLLLDALIFLHYACYPKLTHAISAAACLFPALSLLPPGLSSSRRMCFRTHLSSLSHIFLASFSPVSVSSRHSSCAGGACASGLLQCQQRCSAWRVNSWWTAQGGWRRWLAQREGDECRVKGGLLPLAAGNGASITASLPLISSSLLPHPPNQHGKWSEAVAAVEQLLGEAKVKPTFSMASGRRQQ